MYTISFQKKVRQLTQPPVIQTTENSYTNENITTEVNVV